MRKTIIAGNWKMNKTPEEAKALVTELTGRMGKAQDRRRLFRAVELVKQLQTALFFNANPGQMAGWLAAGLFLES